MDNLTGAEMLKAVMKIAEEGRRLAYKSYLSRAWDATKTEGTYRRQVWRTIRELYSGEIDEFAFLDDFSMFIDNQFTRAWNAGAREMGVNPNQFQDRDIAELARLMEAERNYVYQLADDILRARANGGSLDQFKPRADMWANRYGEIQSRARVWFGGKQMLEWVFGQTVEHCEDCARLRGTVAPADEWAVYRLRPQSRDLECHGYNCRCSLQPTNKAPTPGGLPG